LDGHFQVCTGFGGAAHPEEDSAEVQLRPWIGGIAGNGTSEAFEGGGGVSSPAFGDSQGDRASDVVGFQLQESFEDWDCPSVFGEFVEGDAEVEEQVRGVGSPVSSEFKELDAIPDLSPLAEGDGRRHRVEAGCHPADGEGVGCHLDHPVHAHVPELATEVVVHGVPKGGRGDVPGRLGEEREVKPV
jgi:hypothetical protein